VRREVAVAVVDRLELAAVHGYFTLRQQLELATDGHEVAKDVADAGRVVVAEVGNRLEVRRQASSRARQEFCV
jgi:hypothetical protein